MIAISMASAGMSALALRDLEDFMNQVASQLEDLSWPENAPNLLEWISRLVIVLTKGVSSIVLSPQP